jgi:hypothetical protein
LFARTGLTPREAKAKLSQREASEFLLFCSLYPIDDRSNLQMPIAALRSDLININRDPTKGPPVTLDDCLLFKARDEKEQHIDDVLLSDDW